MRIAYVITHFDSIGGAQVHLLDLAHAMIKDGHEVHILLGGTKAGLEAVRAKGANATHLQFMGREISLLRDVRAVFELRDKLRKVAPDIVHAHSSKAGIVARLAAFAAGIPAVFTAHGWAFTEGVSRRRRWLALMLEKLTAPLAARVIAVSDYDYRLALANRVCRSSKLRRIHNGVLDLVDSPCSIPEEMPPSIVMVARFQEPKRPDLLVTALNELRDLNWRAIIVGDGPDRAKVMSEVRAKGLEDRISLPGHLEDVSSVLSSSQIFVLLSRWEGLPLSILEAMRSGLPVVASNVGGVGEAVRDGETGCLVPAEDLGRLCTVLADLLKDPEARRRLGEQGRCLYEKEFSFDVMCRKTKEVYAEVIKQ
ncbi:glycosyltransferase family 4 protein [Alloalcanivorax xenomutans]|uniref:glycosyltransferase family 4 protein n=1 Tax=Alloalcanivorax xenomutans TaxID=1094342 RepID=UPI00047A72F8